MVLCCGREDLREAQGVSSEVEFRMCWDRSGIGLTLENGLSSAGCLGYYRGVKKVFALGWAGPPTSSNIARPLISAVISQSQSCHSLVSLGSLNAALPVVQPSPQSRPQGHMGDHPHPHSVVSFSSHFSSPKLWCLLCSSAGPVCSPKAQPVEPQLGNWTEAESHGDRGLSL